MLTSLPIMATCKVDGSPDQHPNLFPQPDLERLKKPGTSLLRSVSSSDATSTPKTGKHVAYEKSFSKWSTAMQCKQHVGTKEWVNCEHESCQKLREKLHHLLECPYRSIGGCKQQCIPLREELQWFRNTQPKYPTISHTQLGHQHHAKTVRNGLSDLEGDEIQAKLQALNVEECISRSHFSPTSPAIEDPIQILLHNEKNQELDVEENVVTTVELVPLDKGKLSVINGCFRKGREWEKLSFLGKGSFGTTYLCYDIQKECYFAIKKLRASGFDLEEVKIWERLSGKHPNIVELYGAVESKERVLIFMEYMNGGSVSEYLAEYGPLKERSALQWLHQVLCALEFMHRNFFIHGDVKGANVLLDDTGVHVKLADFGSCVNLRSTEAGGSRRLAGTLAFMAPEICRSEFPTTSADIWSAMCFLIQMRTGKPPWAEYRHEDAALLFVIGSAKRPPQLPSCSEPVQEMFAQGLHVEASSRPSAAQLLRNGVFVFDDSSMELSYDEYDAENSEFKEDSSTLNDVSLEYYSSPPSLLPSSETTEDEYFSSTDDIDHPEDLTITDGATSSQAKTDFLVFKRVDSRGGVLEVSHTSLEVPPNAVQDSTRLGMRCVDPVQFYQPLIDNDLYEDVTILGHVHKFSPPGKNFRESVTVKVTLPENLHQSEQLSVFHGSLNENKNDLVWEDLTSCSSVLPFKDSTIVKVTINHFSYLMALKSTLSLAKEVILSCFNFHATQFRFLILVRLETNSSNNADVRLVMLRESCYSNSCFERFSICRHLIENEGFCAMYGSRREYILPKETLKISLNCSSDRLGSLPDKTHLVQGYFRGEEIANWKLDSTVTQEPLSGTVTLTRSDGQVYRFQFWKHEPTRYVQDVLKLDMLTYTNMLPVAKAVGLDNLEVTEIVVEGSGDEELQLKRITGCWEKKAGNSELTNLHDFISRLPKEALLVSDRGKFHLSHLNNFKQKWDEKSDRDGSVDQNELFFRTMAKNGFEICQSVFSDCLLQLDHSDDAIRMAASVQASVEYVLQNVGEHYPESASQQLGELVNPLTSNEGSHVDAMKSQHFCQLLARSVPWLIQIVKDLFKVQVTKPPTGMWGLVSDVPEIDAAKTTEEQLPCSEVWCQICEVLRTLCERNRWKFAEEDVDLDEMDETLDVVSMLRLLSICDKEWERLAARMKYFRLSLKEITRNKLYWIPSDDLQNVLQWLQRYVTFCPTRLVQFTFATIPSKVAKPLQYDQVSRSFTQTFSLTVEDLPIVHFSMKVDININGCRRSEVVDVSLEICEQAEESHVGCATLEVVYEHNDDGTGLLKVENKCRKFSIRRTIEGNMDQIDGVPNEGTLQECSDTVKFRKGSPTDDELHKIAKEIPKEWKQLGRLLLKKSAVDIIDSDEKGVVEKAIKMLEEWKRSIGSSATYRELYKALCDVSRKDIAEEFCLDVTATEL